MFLGRITKPLQRISFQRNKTRLFMGYCMLSAFMFLYMTSESDEFQSGYRIGEKIVSIIRYYTRPPYPTYTIRENRTTLLEEFGLSGIRLLQPLPTPRPLYKFTIVPTKLENIAQNNDEWGMVVMVKSRTSNQQNRKAIRETWGSVELIGGFRVGVVFVVGESFDAREQYNLDRESKEYGDLLQYEGSDRYDKLLHKILAGVQWASRVVPLHWLLSSADDDIVLNTKRFGEEINNLIKETRREMQKQTNKTEILLSKVLQKLPILCAYDLILYPLVFRQKVNKWQVTKQDYPIEYYPPYCPGAFYTMPIQTASTLFNLSRDLPFFKIDDVWITGVLRLVMQSTGDTKLRNLPENSMAYAQEIRGTRQELVRHVADFNEPSSIRKIWNDFGLR